MSYDFKVANGLRVIAAKSYPWPCGSEPNRMIEIFPDDVLTRDEVGTYTKHTGLGCLRIQIPSDDLVPWDRVVNLRML